MPSGIQPLLAECRTLRNLHPQSSSWTRNATQLANVNALVAAAGSQAAAAKVLNIQPKVLADYIGATTPLKSHVVAVELMMKSYTDLQAAQVASSMLLLSFF